MLVGWGTQEDGKRFPIVAAYRVRTPAGRSAFWSTLLGADVETEECWQLEIDCPFCGHVHRHGSGPTEGSGNGGRVPHCSRTGSSPRPDPFYYELREVGQLPDQSPQKGRKGAKRATAAPRDAISPSVRSRVMERDRFRCRRCGKGPDDERLDIDHITPVSMGGTSEEANLQTLCLTCNLGKSDRPPHEHDMRGRI